ncbi:hypothetical protein KY284_008033 [Solanum tuberosum]|nr:hypothetical protein KY284_008033 [Solanum tuberosum]
MYVKWNPPANSNIMLNTDSGFDSVSGLSTLGGTSSAGLGDPRVSHVYREQNKLADALAAVAITTTLVDNNTMLFWNSPASLTDILRADKEWGVV